MDLDEIKLGTTNLVCSSQGIYAFPEICGKEVFLREFSKTNLLKICPFYKIFNNVKTCSYVLLFSQ